MTKLEYEVVITEIDRLPMEILPLLHKAVRSEEYMIIRDSYHSTMTDM
jgi:predicted AlkP superfamily pyrophosphatase or phosphodiesterase